MLRSLVDEVVRRRLWPIPVIAILVMIAAPLLFMKSSTEAPGPVPPPAKSSALPAAAERVVSTTDKAVARRTKVRGKGQDPFATPSSGAAKDPAATAAAPAATSSASTPVTASSRTPSSATATPVVVQNSDGTTNATAVAKATARKAALERKAAAAKRAAAAKKRAAAKKAAPVVVAPEQRTSSAAARNVTYVDVRFAKRQGTMLRYRVPHLQTFRAGGKVAAMFVHYSAARDVAVFAIAPSTTVAGDVSCRKVKNVCRYVDIPAGAYARLRLRGSDGTLVSRRLDVVSIRHLPLAGNEDAMPLVTPTATASCLLKGLLKLSVSVPSISFDACD